MTEEIIKILNEALVYDEHAITALFETRVPCNYRIANHAKFKVQPIEEAFGGGNLIGLLGLINGMVSPDVIVMVINDNGVVSEFKQIGGKQ